MLVILIQKGIVSQKEMYFRSKDFFDILLEQQMKAQEWKQIDAEQIEKMRESTCLLEGCMKFKCKKDGIIYGLKQCDDPKFFWEFYTVFKGDTIKIHPGCELQIKKRNFFFRKLRHLFTK